MENFMPGYYEGKIVKVDSGAVGENKTPLVKVFFKIESLNAVVPWTGWFSDKTNAKTGKTYTELVIEKLVQLGFLGKCVSEMAEPNADVSKLFKNPEKVWSLDVDFQTDRNGQKTKYLEVKWINDPEKSGTSKLDHAQSVEVFKGMGIKGLLSQARKNAPVDAKEVKKAQGLAANVADDLPF